MKTKKITAFLLALSLTLSIASCNKSDSSSSDKSSETTQNSTAETTNANSSIDDEVRLVFEDLGDGVIMQIGGFDVPVDEYKYYFAYAKSAIDGGNTSYWESDLTIDKLDNLKEQTLSYLFNTYTVYKLAEEYNVELDEKDWEKINEEYEANKRYYEILNEDTNHTFEQYLESICCTEDVYKESIARVYLEYKVVASLYEEDYKQRYFNDYICAKYIRVNSVIDYEVDENNKPTSTPKNFYEIDPRYTYTDEEKAVIEKLNSFTMNDDPEGLKNTLPELMNVIKTRLDAGDDMDTLMNKYTQDTDIPTKSDGSYEGFYLSAGSMSEEFAEVVTALEENQVSDPLYIEGSGYYIIQRTAFDEYYLRDYLLSTYMSDDSFSYASDYSSLSTAIQNEMKISYDIAYDKIDFDFASIGDIGTVQKSDSETTETEENTSEITETDNETEENTSETTVETE